MARLASSDPESPHADSEVETDSPVRLESWRLWLIQGVLPVTVGISTGALGHLLVSRLSSARLRGLGAVLPAVASAVSSTAVHEYIRRLRQRVMRDALNAARSDAGEHLGSAHLGSAQVNDLSWRLGAWALSRGDVDLIERMLAATTALQQTAAFVPAGVRAATSTGVMEGSLRATDDVGMSPQRVLVSASMSAQSSKRSSRRSSLTSHPGGTPPPAKPLLGTDSAVSARTTPAAPPAVSPHSQHSCSGVSRGHRSYAGSPRSTCKSPRAHPSPGGCAQPDPTPLTPGSQWSSPTRSLRGRSAAAGATFEGANWDAVSGMSGAVLCVYLGTSDQALDAGVLGGILPAEVADAAATQLGVAIDIVTQAGGIVHQFDLATLIATFNVQSRVPDFCHVAADCALHIDDELASLADAAESMGILPIPWGIGLAEGPLLAGFTGTARQKAVVVCGAAADAAKDLARLNPMIDSSILMTQSFHDRVQNDVRALLVDFVCYTENRQLQSAATASNHSPLCLQSTRQHFGDDESPFGSPTASPVMKGARARAPPSHCVFGVYQLLGDLTFPTFHADDLAQHVQGLFLMRQGNYAAAARAFATAATGVESREYASAEAPDASQMQRLKHAAETLDHHPELAPPAPYARCVQPRWPQFVDPAVEASMNSRFGGSYGSLGSPFSSAGSPFRQARASAPTLGSFGSDAAPIELGAIGRRRSQLLASREANSPAKVLEAIQRARSRSLLSPVREEQAVEVAVQAPKALVALATEEPAPLLSDPPAIVSRMASPEAESAAMSPAASTRAGSPDPHGGTRVASPVESGVSPPASVAGRTLTPARSPPAAPDVCGSPDIPAMQSLDAPHLEASSRAPAPLEVANFVAADHSPDSTVNEDAAGSPPAASSGVCADEFADFVKGDVLRDVGGTVWRRSYKLLGRGAFGDVYLGMRVGDGKLTAMKYIDIPSVEATDRANHVSPRVRREGQRAEERLGGLLSEVRILSSLRHANVVACHGFAVVDKSLVLALEYVSGGSLQGMLDEFGAIPVSVTQRLLTDVLRGLRYLHSQRIVHRDVKPANVLLDVGGICKLTDFGTSTKVRRSGPAGGSKALVVGTPAFMAPEQARGLEFTTRNSDLWSVGVMALQMLTGKLPFDMSLPFAADRHIYRLAFDVDFKVDIPDAITGDARCFIEQCFRRDEAERGSAEELLLHPFLAVPAASRHDSSAVASQGQDSGLISPARRRGQHSSRRARRSVSFNGKPLGGAGSPNASDDVAGSRVTAAELTPHPRKSQQSGQSGESPTALRPIDPLEDPAAEESAGYGSGSVASPDPSSPAAAAGAGTYCEDGADEPRAKHDMEP